MDIELIHKLGLNNVVFDVFYHKEEYQEELCMGTIQILCAMFVNENDIERIIKKRYMKNHLCHVLMCWKQNCA
jgi:hypothetical protein